MKDKIRKYILLLHFLTNNKTGLHLESQLPTVVLQFVIQISLSADKFQKQLLNTNDNLKVSAVIINIKIT